MKLIESSSEEYWAEIQSLLNAKLGRPAICNDPSLYSFGSYWEKIFLRLPRLLDIYSSAEVYENDTQEGLQAGIEAEDMDAQISEESGYDPEEDSNPWPSFYAQYHMRLVIGRLQILDATAFAREGRDAGTVLVVWVDECGRAIRYSRMELNGASDNATLSDCMLDDHSCWANAQIGESYEWGAPLGPPLWREW